MIKPYLLYLAAATKVVPPASQGRWVTQPKGLKLTVPTTDTQAIAATVNNVNQKSGASAATPPDRPVANTAVTAVDGSLTTAGSASHSSTTSRSFSKRSNGFSGRSSDDYELVFSGTGTGPNDRDASIEGTAYLTYSLVSNATYNVDDCLDKCDQVDTCGKSRIHTKMRYRELTIGYISFRQYLLRVK